MGIFVTKQRAQQGPVFGFQDKFEGLGIFVDTYKNNRPGVVFPYVMAMLGDGQTAYDQANDGKSNELAGCSVCLRWWQKKDDSTLTCTSIGSRYSQRSIPNQNEDYILCGEVSHR